MSIRNVPSTLPDPEYIRALEAELADLRALIERIRLDSISQRR
jgi:hypothetical protein